MSDLKTKIVEEMNKSQKAKVTKRCRQCNAEFETLNPRRYKCRDCKVYSKSTEKLAAEEARRKLPNMTMDEMHIAFHEGRRWFTNGGTRWRYVMGFEMFYVRYTTGNGTTTYESVDRFLKWARGAYKEKGGGFE